MELKVLDEQEVQKLFQRQAGYTNKCIEEKETGNLTLDDLFAACACCRHSGTSVYVDAKNPKEILQVQLNRTEDGMSDYCLDCKVEILRRRMKDAEAKAREEEAMKAKEERMQKEEERHVTLEETDEFYDWLQGKSQPDGFIFRAAPELTPEQAFSIIYYLQEKLFLIPDTYERCDNCGCLYDSDEEGTSIDEYSTIITEEGEEVLANFPKEMYGLYCDNCRPDDITEPYDAQDEED